MLDEPQILRDALFSLAYKRFWPTALTSSILPLETRTSLFVVWAMVAEDSNGKVIAEAAAADINVLRRVRALRSAFIFIT